MPLSETNKVQSQSIEDLIAQLDSPTQTGTHSPVNTNNGTSNRKSLRGKRTTSLSLSLSASSTSNPTFYRNNSNGQNNEPLLNKNIITSKKYTKHLKSMNNRGMVKKNGAGGKHTWGAPGCELADYYLDSKDPNYDSEDGGNVIMSNEESLKELDTGDLELEIKPVILEYFQNGDTIEVIDHLKCYSLRNIRPQLVSYLVQISLENNNTCKELMSRLLRDLTFELMDEQDYVSGFDLLLKNVHDLTLDNPDAPEKIGTFIARAIADKVITRAYMEKLYEEESHDLSYPLVAKAVESARSLVNMNDHLYQLSHIWGNKGGFLAVTELSDKMKEIIQEYYDSRDVEEAIRCLKELNVPHFHHELVFEAIDFTLQKGNNHSIDLITELLRRLCESVIVTYDQLKMVFF